MVRLYVIKSTFYTCLSVCSYIGIRTANQYTQLLSFSVQQLGNNLSVDDEKRITHPLRHRYDIVLTRNRNALVIFDHRGNTHTFNKTQQGGYTADNQSAGMISFQPEQTSWLSNTGITHRFKGSRLIGISHGQHYALALTYENGFLSSVTDQSGRSLLLDYHAGQLASVHFPDGNQATFAGNASQFGNSSGHPALKDGPETGSDNTPIGECRPTPSMPEDPPTQPIDQPIDQPIHRSN